ncbi:glycosyltransferase domain-containing protein [Flavicella sp.]|uniref:glycosyltransferase domain-containing protein n=1 Tax=Flavicella sp. TaxID=2957742 RepID=UPI003017E02A
MTEPKIVVYTALFGNYSGLIEQPKIEGVDYICYTDQDFTSNSWKIIKVEPPILNDNTRSNRYYKINPHLHLKEYETSVYIDANYLIIADFSSMVINKLKDFDMVCFDHNQTILDPRDCIYKEHEELVKIAEINNNHRDSLEVMEDQINYLKSNCYPQNNGLIFAAVLIRKHNKEDVKALMELWWGFVKKRSKRDQLSFNYCTWKLNFKKILYLSCDLRRGNPWFYWFDHKLDFSKDLKELRKEIFIKKHLPLIRTFLNSKFVKKLVFITTYPYIKLKFTTWCKRYYKGTLTQEEELYLFKKTKKNYFTKSDIVSQIYKLTKGKH